MGDNETFWPTAKSIYIQNTSIIFRIAKFYNWYAPLIEWVHIARAIAWPLSEMFIIILAVNLSLMFRKFNERLIRTQSQVMWSSYWKEMREHFLQICNLVDHANDFISPLITVIIFCDFFFLCERLYRLFA